MAPTERGPAQTTVLRASTRRAGIGANVALQLLLASAVLVMLNYLALRHYHRFDWTEQNLYTLSEQSNGVLRALPREVSLIVMMSQADSLFEPTREMLDRYVAAAGSKLAVRYVDPDLDPTEFERVLEEYPIQGGVTEEGALMVAQTIVVTAGDRRQFVSPEEDFVQYDQRGRGGLDFTNRAAFNPPRAELSLTSAIYGVTEGRQRVVCFSSGHGEWEVSGLGQDRDRSVSALSDFMEHYEIEFREVPLAMGQPPALEECTAVVVAGPRRPFLPGEALHLQRFVDERGGDLVLFLDPVVRTGRFVPTGLEALARRYGVALHEDEVANGGPTGQFCGGGHPTSFVALGAGERRVCVERTRSLAVVEGRDGQPFLETVSDEAFGEVSAEQLSNPQRDEADRPGPLTLGIVVEQDNEEARTARIEAQRDEREQDLTEADRRGSRVIVVGDSDFLGARHMRYPGLGNVEVAVNILFSVAGSEVLVAVPPREVEREQLALEDDQVSNAFLLFVLGLPLLAVVAGVSVWWTRRR